MSTFRHLYLHVQTYGMKHRHLYLVSLMFFFWKIFDGIISYITPIVITEQGVSKTSMGLIYSSSSIFGAIFDIVLSKYLKNTSYRRIFIFLMIVSLIHPLVLWQAKTIWMFLLAMGTWGLYYDLANFGTLDFVSRKLNPEEHASGFGVLDVFRAMGNLIAPIIAGLLIVGLIDWKLYAISGIFLGVAIFILIILLIFSKKSHYEYIKLQKEKDTTVLGEIFLLIKTFKKVYPFFVLTCLIFTVDAFFWTIGPLFSEEFSLVHPLNGMFLAGYSFSTLIIGWFVGGISNKFGKNKTAYYSFFFACIMLIPFIFLKSLPLLLFISVLIVSGLIAVSLSTTKSIFSDIVLEKPNKENEVGAWSDLGTNMGFIVGPMSAGFLADRFGNMETFTILGILGTIISIYFIAILKKRLL